MFQSPQVTINLPQFPPPGYPIIPQWIPDNGLEFDNAIRQYQLRMYSTTWRILKPCEKFVKRGQVILAINNMVKLMWSIYPRERNTLFAGNHSIHVPAPRLQIAVSNPSHCPNTSMMQHNRSETLLAVKSICNSHGWSQSAHNHLKPSCINFPLKLFFSSDNLKYTSTRHKEKKKLNV